MVLVVSSLTLAMMLQVIDGTEVVWQRPPVTAPPRGVLLALHGCLHSALDWFPRGATCPDCIGEHAAAALLCYLRTGVQPQPPARHTNSSHAGLPEEVRATSAALLRGYMVVAASSLDRRHRRCWALPRRPDRPSVDTRAVRQEAPASASCNGALSDANAWLYGTLAAACASGCPAGTPACICCHSSHAPARRPAGGRAGGAAAARGPGRAAAACARRLVRRRDGAAAAGPCAARR